MNTLKVGKKLRVDEKLFSLNGHFFVILQQDGNFVLYDKSLKPHWATNTVGSNASYITMQLDGNLVLYTKKRNAVWASNTENHSGSFFTIQDDGNLVIYSNKTKPVWASNTVIRRTRFCGVPDEVGQHPIDIQTFGSPGGRWKKGALTVYIDARNCTGMSHEDAVAVIMSAFHQWEQASLFFTFSQTNTPNADIRVGFGGKDIYDKFGSEGGVVGAGFFPPIGKLFFDSSETWHEGLLLGVALHEIGHVLGLRHSNAPDSIMYPFTTNNNTALDEETSSAINLMYSWRDQQKINGIGTAESPFLIESNGVIFMYWRGVKNDQGIYWSSYNGESWRPQSKIKGIGSSHGPSVTEFDERFMMVWKGINDDQGIYYSISDRNKTNWSPQRKISGVGTDSKPAIFYHDGTVQMAWKGIKGDSAIYTSNFDASDNLWSQQTKLPGRGSSSSPTLVSLNNTLYMFWKGVDGDSKVYYSFHKDLWQPQKIVSYPKSDVTGIFNIEIGSSHFLSTSALSAKNKLILAWKGVADDSSIWFSIFDGDEFSGQINIPNVGTSSSPSVVTWKNGLFLAWKGVGDDQGIYFTSME